MNNLKLASDLVDLAKHLLTKENKRIAKFPPKAVDLNKLKDTDGFWKWKLNEAEKEAAIKLKNPKDMGDLIFFLNMAALAWEDK